MLLLSAWGAVAAASETVTIPAKIYYVSTTGNDANDGLTPATAWGSISKVNSLPLATGDIILFERGGVFRGAGLFPQVGGLTYGAYGSGAKPEITGAPDLSSASAWTHATNGRWTASVPQDGGQDPEIVWFDGTRRAPEANTAAVESGNPSDWYWESGTLHVQTGGAGINPTSVWSDISVNQLEYGMYNNGIDWPDLRFEDLVFTHFRYGVYNHGHNNSCYRVEVHRCSRNNFDWRAANGYLEECVSTDNGLTGVQGAHGYNFTLGATGCTMKDCVADDNREDNVQFNDTCGDNITIDGGSFTNPGENCFDRKAGTGHVLKNLTCSNDSDHPTIDLHTTSPGVLGECTIENVTAEHSSSNVVLDVIEGNICYSRNSRYVANTSANQAVRVRSLTGDSDPGNWSMARFESSYDEIWCRSSGPALQFDSGSTVFLDHCTLVSNGGRGIEADPQDVGGSTMRLRARDCIVWSATGKSPLYLITNIDHSDTDYCLLFRDQTGSGINLVSYPQDTLGDSSDWGDYNRGEIEDGTHFSERGVLEHVFTSDPLFANRTGGDFGLQGGSPALNAASDGGDLGAWQQT
jgi:hypothetical protein